MRKALYLLIATFGFKPLFAQTDTAVYKDNTRIPLVHILTTGRGLPATWLSLSVVNVEGTYFGSKGWYADAGYLLTVNQYYRGAYAGINLSLIERKRMVSSGKVTLHIQPSNNPRYLYTMYMARFKGIERVSNIGLHLGVQRLVNTTEAYYDFQTIPNLTATINLTHELDFGISIWTRQGIVTTTPASTTGRFFILKLTMDAVKYRFSKFAVWDLNTLPSGVITRHEYGDDDPNGRWTFEDLPFNDWGARLVADFMWSPRSGKRSPSFMIGYRLRFMMQYVPISLMGANLLPVINVGVTLGGRPRSVVPANSVTPCLANPKNTRKGR
jgi:hypothetical protein